MSLLPMLKVTGKSCKYIHVCCFDINPRWPTGRSRVQVVLVPSICMFAIVFATLSKTLAGFHTYMGTCESSIRTCDWKGKKTFGSQAC